MTRPVRPRRLACLLLATALASLAAAAGCAPERTQEKVPPRYPTIERPKDMPAYLSGSVYEYTVLGNNQPLDTSAYGLVGQLRGTGDCTAPSTVRQFMMKELARHSFGDPLVPGFGSILPSDVLRDPNYAIVRIDGLIPPGARKGDWFDVQVSCLSNNNTTSLAHGTLFETDLHNGGANTENPGGRVNVFARCKGPILVNPAYALEGGPTPTGPARASLRSGVVMYNGLVMLDRPIFLQLRQPQRSMARRIETRISERFQDATDRTKGNGGPGLAEAEDEGLVNVFVPHVYRGDWEHYIGVVQHLFLENTPEFNARKSKLLVEEAQKPDALLADVSYCWEGIGKEALPFIQPLLTHAQPEIAFAAARAAAFIGDASGAADERLAQMALTPGHPFQLSAVQVLGALRPSSELNHKLRALLDAEQATIRVEAYKILARNGDGSVATSLIAPAGDPENQKFALDVVDSDGPPIIYASRHGAPRIAVIGKRPEVRTPAFFSAIDHRLTINAPAGAHAVTVFYRDPLRREPVKIVSQLDAPELIARLGGAGSRDEEHLTFTYGEVVAIVQSMADSGQFAADDNGHLYAASFLLQEMPRVQNVIRTAPVIVGDAGAAATSPPGRGTGGMLLPGGR